MFYSQTCENIKLIIFTLDGGLLDLNRQDIIIIEVHVKPIIKLLLVKIFLKCLEI